jgi:Zn-dependent protease
MVGAPQAPRNITFSQTELRHIAVGTALVSVSGASIFAGDIFPSMLTLALAVLFFSAGFILHELAHKFVAQRYGLWAEFRLDRFGALLTLVTAISPFFKIIAPGAVMIAGPTSKRAVGFTSVAGPIVNLVLAVGLYGLSLVPGSVQVSLAAHAGASINAFIALFNVLPFGPLDGRKILHWDKLGWAALFLASIATTGFLYFGLFG